jgi:hypothetical protein
MMIDLNEGLNWGYIMQSKRAVLFRMLMITIRILVIAIGAAFLTFFVIKMIFNISILALIVAIATGLFLFVVGILLFINLIDKEVYNSKRQIYKLSRQPFPINEDQDVVESVRPNVIKNKKLLGLQKNRNSIRYRFIKLYRSFFVHR